MTANVALGGTATFYLDGVFQELAGTFKVDIGGVIRTPAIGPSGPTGKWTQKYEAPMIEAEIFDDPKLSLKAIQGINGKTVQLNLASGKIYVIYNAFNVDKIELDGVAGKFDVKFSGSNIMEVTN